MKSDGKQKSKRRGVIILIAGILVSFIALEFLQLGGNTRFYTTWIYCGQKPVATEDSMQSGSLVIYHYEPTALPGVHASWNYFCTPLEAEQAGYSASPTQYEFPNLQRGA